MERSVKLDTACGDSPADTAPTRRTLDASSVPSISAAFLLTPRGPTATAAANRSSESSARQQNNSAVGGPDKKLYVATKKFRPKTANGPGAAISLSTIAFPTDYIEEYVNKSLANLGVEKLDLIQFHTWEDRWLNGRTPPARRGKVAHQWQSRSRRRQRHRWEPYNGFPPCSKASPRRPGHLHIFDQNPEDALFPFCRMKNVRRDRPRPVR